MKQRVPFSSFLLFLSAASFSWGAPIYWNGSSGTLWSNAANWSVNSDGTGASGLPTASDVATFSGSNISAATAVSLDANQAIAGINFVGQASVTITSDSASRVINLGTSGITAAGTPSSGSAPTRVYTIGSTTAANNLTLSLQGSQSWISNLGGTTVNAGDGIMVRANVSLGVTGTHTLTLGGSSGSTPQNLISGVISNGGVDRTLNIALNPGSSNGTNRWTLSGNNTYTGTTVISNGALTISHGNALGSTTVGTTVESGAGLFLRNTVASLAAESITLSGTGPDNKGALRNVGGSNTWNGLISATTASGSVTIGAGGGSNFTIANAATISTGASGTLQFHTDTDTAGTAVGTITVNADITGAAGVRKIGSSVGILNLSGTAKSYSGATTLSNGYLAINTTLSNTSAVTTEAGTTLRGNNGFINAGAITTIRGTLAPGLPVVGTPTSSIGTLTMGSLIQSADSMLAIDLDSGTSAIDRLNVSALTLNGTVTLSLNDIGTSILNMGDALLFIKTTGAVTGKFTIGGVTIEDESTTFTVGANTFMLDYDRTIGSDTGVALVTVIPEPASAMLAMLSLSAFAIRRRRRG